MTTREPQPSDGPDYHSEHSAWQNHQVTRPVHYTSSPAKCECGKPIECIQITEHMGFNIGNSVKYLWRCDLKNDAIEDLEKAAWYVLREIDKRKRELSAT